MAKAKRNTKGKTQPRKPPRELKAKVADMVSEAFGEIESLREELESWRDNLPPSKQGSSKNEELDEAINQLEASSEPTIDDELGGVEVIYFEHTGKQGTSRSARRNNAVDTINNVIEKLEGLDVEGAEELKTELENAVSEWEACEFPGMFG